MASDVEKANVHATTSPTATPVDTAKATENPEGADCINDTHSITPASSDLPPAFEEKDPRDPISLHYSPTSQDSPIVVSRSNRRGLFGQLALLAEVENPKTYSRNKKWFITFIVAVAGATAPMGSSIFFRE